MNSKIFYRIKNRFRDRLEDLRLEGQITWDQENYIWDVFEEILRTAKYKNPFKIKYYDEAMKEKSQPIRAILDGESITDLEDFCCRLDVAYARLLLKIEDREKYLKKMKLLTNEGQKIRVRVIERLKKSKLGLFKECSFYSNECNELSKAKINIDHESER